MGLMCIGDCWGRREARGDGAGTKEGTEVVRTARERVMGVTDSVAVRETDTTEEGSAGAGSSTAGDASSDEAG